jgi:hypothetical protein
MKTRNLLVLALFTSLLTSCATIFTGTKDVISFDSEPKGAMVYIDGLEVCRTPCRTPVKRSLEGKQVELSLDGYETRVILLDTKFNLVSVLNLGNILGWGIDALTGTIMRYDRKNYKVELQKSKRVSYYFENAEKIEVDSKNKVVTLSVSEKAMLSEPTETVN